MNCCLRFSTHYRYSLYQSTLYGALTQSKGTKLLQRTSITSKNGFRYKMLEF